MPTIAERNIETYGPKPMPQRKLAQPEPHVHGPDCSHEHHAPATPFQRSEPKVGRNDVCPCGSGKKFKKCHGVAG